jgi:hypothetical protein
MSIIKEDPPQRSPRGAKVSEYWSGIADQLKADPGAWYRILDGEKHAGLASQIRSGRSAAFLPKGSFEATSRKSDDDNTWSVWARYVGEGSALEAEG